jgi:MoaA/NifB/PqqE/SkfB family radical SAM enzyme
MPTEAQMAVNLIAYVDLVDVCNLKCPTCVRGVRAIPNSPKRMPLSKFDDIVAKLKSEGFKWVGLYNWTEPFLNRNLQDYVAVVKAHGLMCIVSTNFSLRRIDNLEAALGAGIDHLVITVSGFDQAVYEINHVAGDVDYVKANTERVAALKRSGAIDTYVVLRFLRFAYNQDQEAKLARYAQDIGIGFEAIEGGGNPFSDDLSRMSNEHYRAAISGVGSERPYDEPGKVCPLMFGQGASIDHAGKAYLCCAYPTHETLEVGMYLDVPFEELLFRKFNHPICATCSFPRRDASAADKQLAFEALQYRLGQTAIG